MSFISSYEVFVAFVGVLAASVLAIVIYNQKVHPVRPMSQIGLKRFRQFWVSLPLLVYSVIVSLTLPYTLQGNSTSTGNIFAVLYIFVGLIVSLSVVPVVAVWYRYGKDTLFTNKIADNKPER